jgi:hypothetical protein
MTEVNKVLLKTDWALLAQQKLALLRVTDEGLEGLEGLLNFLDALQDAAEADGHPVVWLTEADVETPS